jgi:hypothetical protein
MGTSWNDAFRDNKHSALNGSIVCTSAAVVPVAWGQPAGGDLKLVAISDKVRNYISDILCI